MYKREEMNKILGISLFILLAILVVVIDMLLFKLAINNELLQNNIHCIVFSVFIFIADFVIIAIPVFFILDEIHYD